MSAPPPILTVEGVSRRFGRRQALAPTTFSLEAGRGVALMGANGSGKTTLLRIIAGLLRPTEGTVRLLGEEPRRSPAARGRIGWLGHELGLYDELTAVENLRFHAALQPDPVDASGIARALDTVGLAERATARVSALSRGMKERLALARLLLHRPDLFLLDEPTTGLDAGSVAVLGEMIRSWLVRGATVLISTHDAAFAAALGLGELRLQ
jgi:heme ABC exporter ATP-binding subunit CcmA